MKKRMLTVVFAVILMLSFKHLYGADLKIKAMSVTASSFEEEFKPENVIDGNPKTRWSSKFSDPQWITADLGVNKTVDRVVIHWESAYAELYQLQVSEDGKTWYVVYGAVKKEEGKDEINFKPVSVRYIKVYGIKRKTGWGYSVYEIEVFSSGSKAAPLKEFKTFSEFKYKPSDLMPDAFYKISAPSFPGYYPIWVGNLQGYWTVAGTVDGYRESLISEDGSVEVYPRGWSLIPYLYINNKLITRADAEITQSLGKKYLPVPSVKWELDGLNFEQKLFSYDDRGKSVTHISYELTNKGGKEINGKLFLTVRPFQVTPSWQGDGGMTDVFAIDFENAKNNKILINAKTPLYSVTAPSGSGAVSYLEGDVMDFIKEGKAPPYKTVYDPWGGATGVMVYNFKLPAKESREFLFTASPEEENKYYPITKEQFDKNLTKTLSFWEEKLNRIKINVADKYLTDVLRSNIAYILINRDGPVIQPGSRHYERSWIRDSAVICIALMRTGYIKEVKDYIDWISDRQLFNGDVPCMINTDGSVWDWGKTLPEYDGQGAYITLVWEYYKFTNDKEYLKEKMPNVVKALEFLEHLRAKRLTDEYKNGPDEKKIFYGILPNSVSHEGYAQPGVHSYWDDFWALKGWRAAIEMAEITGRRDLLPWMEKEESDFRKCFYGSIKLVQKIKNIKYIPGCADKADFDACATAISVWPTDEYKNFTNEELLYTFDKYFNETLMPRMRGEADPDAGYVPYEIRTATAYLLLGHKEKALKMLEHFLGVTTPKDWNQWAEVVYGNYRKAGYIGDMPHAWISADYINLVRPMFVYEKDDMLILGAGIDERWLDKQGVYIENLPTHFGKISYSIEKKGSELKVKVWGDASAPRGYEFKSPYLKKQIKSAKINGNKLKNMQNNNIEFTGLPAEIVIEY